MTERIVSTRLAEHRSRASCWLAIHGKVWDVTNFLSQHPGGAGLLLKAAGQDATAQYEQFHDASLVEETLGVDALVGELDQTERTTTNPDPRSQDQENARRSPPLRTMLALADFEKVAQEFMSPTAWAYVSSGADDEISARENAAAYRNVYLRGRVLRKVGQVDCSTSILGYKSSMPIYTSPVGLGKLVHPKGECAIAAADGREGIIQVVNTVSSWPIESIMDSRVSKDQTIFWQLYADKDLHKSKAFIDRVMKAGVKAIWLTVDSPVLGNREKDERSQAVIERDEPIESVVESVSSAGIAKANTGFINPDLDWSMVAWLRDATKLPIVIKGIQCVEDAVTAHSHGVDGIVLSNHGGRSQDTAQPPLLTLLEINTFAPHILSGYMQVFVDGGIRRGTDIIKALALGATAVGIGRPTLYSMAGGYGEFGVRRMIQILRKELQTNMAFIGASNVKGIERSMVNTKRLEQWLVSSVKL